MAEGRPGAALRLGPGEARRAAWAHVLPPFGSLAVQWSTRRPSVALRRVLSQAHRLGGVLLGGLVLLSLMASAVAGLGPGALGAVGVLVLLDLAAWVGGGAWLAWRAARGAVPVLWAPPPR